MGISFPQHRGKLPYVAGPYLDWGIRHLGRKPTDSELNPLSNLLLSWRNPTARCTFVMTKIVLPSYRDKSKLLGETSVLRKLP